MKIKIQKKIAIIMIVMTVVSILNINIFAATTGSFNVSSSSSNLNIGETATLKINVSNCEGQFSISSSNPSVASVSSSSEWVDGNGKSITITAKSAGNATITVTAENVGDNQPEPEDVTGSKNVSITVKTPSTATPTPQAGGGNTGGNSSSTGNSSNNNSSSTTTQPSFKDASKTVYATGDINLRSSWSTSSNAVQVSKGTELRLTGTSSEKVNGYVWYRVTYNGQIKYVSKDLITETNPNPAEENKPEEEKKEEANANLKKLSITGIDLEPEFSPDVTVYTAKISNYEDSEINVTAEAEDEKATVKIEGNDNIAIGENTIGITVTAEDGTKKIYTIKLTNEKATVFGLKTLKIKDVKIKNFTTDIYEYEVEFKELDKLEIEAVATEEDATIEIIGNEELKEGKNTITIMVTSKDGEKTATYQIVANKLVVVEEKTQIPMMKLVISGLIALVILIIIIILIVKYVKNRDDSNIDYVYNDNLKDNDNIDDEDVKEYKKDTEVAEEIAPEIKEDVSERKSKVDQLFDNDDEYRRPRKGKHSK